MHADALAGCLGEAVQAGVRGFCSLFDQADVVELFLQDHRKTEELFRLMRSIEADRAAALREFSDLLIAHALAEEAKAYPALKRYMKSDDEELEHGEQPAVPVDNVRCIVNS